MSHPTLRRRPMDSRKQVLTAVDVVDCFREGDGDLPAYRREQALREASRLSGLPYSRVLLLAAFVDAPEETPQGGPQSPPASPVVLAYTPT